MIKLKQKLMARYIAAKENLWFTLTIFTEPDQITHFAVVQSAKKNVSETHAHKTHKRN